MRVLATLALAWVLLALESVLLPAMGLSVARFDATVVLLVLLGLRAPTLSGAFAAYAVGYMLDVFTGHPTGLYPFLGVLVFLLTRVVRALLDVRSAPMFAVTVAGASLGHGVFAAFLTWLTSRVGEGQAASLAGLPLQMVLSGILAALMWPLVSRVYPPTERSEPGLLGVR